MAKDYDYEIPLPIEAHSKCAACGRIFYIPDKAQYVYKRDEAQDGRLIRKYFCSWSCLCSYEKEAGGYKPRLAFYCDRSLRKWLDEQALSDKQTISQTIVRMLHKAQKESRE